MKKIFLMAVLFTATMVTFFGCGKDKGDDKTIQKENKTLNITLNEDNVCGITGQYYEETLNQLGDLRKDPTTGEIFIVISCNNLTRVSIIQLVESFLKSPNWLSVSS